MRQSEELGVLLLLFSLCCLGTWPALLRLCSFRQRNNDDQHHLMDPSVQSFFSRRPRMGNHVPQSLFKPGGIVRNLCHVYMDYSASYFVVSSVPLLVAILLSKESFLATFSPPLILVAMLGGSLLSYGNLSMQWATSIYNAPLTTTLAIQASLTVILGTFLNFALEPDKTHKPKMLVGGVLVFLVAIALAAKAQLMCAMAASSSRLPARPTQIELDVLPNNNSSCQGGIRPSNSYLSLSSLSWDAASLLEFTTATRERTLHGILVAVSGGVAFGFFSPAFNIAVNDPFQWSSINSGSDGLMVARINIWFSFSFWLASFVGNVLLLRREEEQVYHQRQEERRQLQEQHHQADASVASSMDQDESYNPPSVLHILWVYLTKDPLSERLLAFMAGVVCALGNALQFQAGKMVGFATSDLVQAYPLVTTLWDVLLFEEFSHVHFFKSSLGAVLVLMYVAYLAGIALLAGSCIT